MKHPLFITAAILILIAVSCNEKSDDGNLKKATEKNQSNIQNGDNQMQGMNDLQFVPEKPDEKVDLKKKEGDSFLEPKILQTFLPAEIPGFEKYPWDGGISSDDNLSWSSVSADYVYKRSGHINYAIFDYGKKGNLPQNYDFTNLPRDPGMQTIDFKLKYGRGFYQWNENLKTGKLYAEIANRFKIEINAEKLPEKAGSLIDILDKVDFDKLINAK